MPTDSDANPRFRAGVAPRSAIAWHVAIVAGLCIGLLGAVVSLSPSGRWVERTIARDWLFSARGARESPGDVLVVSMDEHAADLSAVTRDDRRWSRHLYAQLIERLVLAGAEAVVLDVAFEDETEVAADRALESALSGSDRVVLFQRLTRTAVGDVPVPPLARFAMAARLRAVFPLPKRPAFVEYYWPFFRALQPVGASGQAVASVRGVPGDDYALAELPSLPVAALLLEVLQLIGTERFDRLLREIGQASGPDEAMVFARPGELGRATAELRRAAMGGRLSGDAARRAVRERFDENDAAAPLLQALFAVFSEPSVLHLNFYGPPRTIATLEHDEVLDRRRNPTEELRGTVAGRVVFVGHSSRSAVDQKDGFRTVYTRDDGVDLSGVEIAATAYANLADDSVLRPVAPGSALLIHVLLGVVSVLLASRAGVVRAIVLTVAFALGYFALSVQAIAVAHRLLPLGVPLLLTLPFALFSVLLYRHLATRRQRDRYRHGVRLMMPPRAVRDIESDRVESAVPERLHGACMITDVAGYTRLSERLPAERLATLSREYFARLTEQVELADGELIDIEGDSMTAVWAGADRSGGNGRLAAQAAVEIVHAVERFNERHADTPMPTRIGLHAGEVTAGNIGGGRSFRHRVIGDIVNTSSRLEGLNKRLGTSVLATRAVIDAADALLVRPVGVFALKGKSEVLELFEVIGHRSSATVGERASCEGYARALRALAAGDHDAAERVFVDILRAAGDEGPARFYVELMNGRGTPDVRLDEGGVVRVDGK